MAINPTAKPGVARAPVPKDLGMKAKALVPKPATPTAKPVVKPVVKPVTPAAKSAANRIANLGDFAHPPKGKKKS